MGKPEIRFKGYTDEWEQRKLGDIATFINGRAYSQDELLSSGKYKVLRVGNFYTNDSWYYSDMELDDKYYAEKGDLLYTWSATFGPHIWRGDKVIYHYHIWKIELSKALEKSFALQLLEQDKQAILSDKNGSTMVHITKAGMEGKEVLLPRNINEQAKIGNYFSTLDNFITLHQRKCDEVKSLKKYMLQKMFPQNEQKIPEIRFEGFTEAWEQRKYAEVIELLSGQDFNPEEYNEDGIGIPYLTGASCIENGCTTAVRWTEKPRCIVEKGDTVLVCKGSGYGTIATVNQEKAHIARQFMALKVKKHELDYRFNYFLLNSVVENIKTDARGLIAGIARDAVLKQEIVIPCLNEQTKIGEYFDNLDKMITLHQQKYEELKKIKKFMLQKMFV